MRLPWENKEVELPLKKEIPITQLIPEYSRPINDQYLPALIKSGLLQIKDQIRNASSIVLILEDPSRPSRTTRLVEGIYQGIMDLTGHSASFKTVIAAGAHHHIQAVDLCCKMKDYSIPHRIHDSTDQANLVQVGTSKSGIPLYFNREVVEAGLRISVATINIHPLAGFSGGGKILLPGVAGLDTIQAFHNLPPGIPGREPSAMRDLINEVLSFLPITYSWHQISAPDGEITAIFGGRLPDSFRQAKDELLKVVTVKNSAGLADLLLLGCRPYNQNLIGTFKSLHQIPLLLKPGGRVVLLNEAPQGIGFHHWRNQPEIVAQQKEHYRRQLKNYRVAIFTPEIKKTEFDTVFPTAFHLLNTPQDLAEFLLETDYRTVTVLPYAPVTLVAAD